MTILIGAIHNGYAYVGADSLWTWDDQFVRESKVSKFIQLDDDKVLIATSGQDKFTQIFERVIETDPELLNFNDRRSLRDLVDALHKEVHKAGVGDSDNNQLPDHDLGFLLVSKLTNKIWVIESDYSIGEFDDFVCAGSGAFLGEGAMRALAKVGIFGKDAVKLAIETVNELHPYCGGKIEIKKIKLK